MEREIRKTEKGQGGGGGGEGGEGGGGGVCVQHPEGSRQMSFELLRKCLK